ncbi:MAG TPA: TIGR02186 family protein [Stellaceae bacterium]|nr:TIGR02186 family protein [Stellaceae bacterium]
MRRTAWFVIAALAIGSSPAAGAEPLLAEPLIADLTSHLIAITTGFTGTNVVLFGATEGEGDVIVVVRGPEREIVVRRKSRVAGIWLNTDEVTFTGAPSYYAVFSNEPLEAMAPPAILALHQIGAANLRLGTLERNRSPEEIAAFRTALVREQQSQGLFADGVGRVNFLPGHRLFRTNITFPANVPTGTYHVEVLLVRDRKVVSAQTTPLVVSQIGIDAEVNEFAERSALIYGIVAVAGAAMAGWLASLPFRNA